MKYENTLPANNYCILLCSVLQIYWITLFFTL